MGHVGELKKIDQSFPNKVSEKDIVVKIV